MEVKTIAVIGAGTMGRGIAHAAAVAGFETILQDVSDAALAKAQQWIREALEAGVKRGKVQPAMRAATSAADIDKAVKLGLHHPMGPFEMVDLVGLDMRLKILEYLHETLGEITAECAVAEICRGRSPGAEDGARCVGLPRASINEYASVGLRKGSKLRP